MKPILLTFALVVSLPISAQAAEVSIPADNLEAACMGVPSPRLYVSAGGKTIYQTTEYRVPYTSADCANHAHQVQSMFNAAADAGRKISFRPSGNNPLKDFTIAEGMPAGISPAGLQVSCVGHNWKRLLVVDGHGRTIYRTSEYSIPYNDDDCYEAAAQARVVISAAKAVGKKVDFRHSDAPAKDIAVSSETDPLGSQSFRQREPGDDAEMTSTSAS